MRARGGGHVDPATGIGGKRARPQVGPNQRAHARGGLDGVVVAGVTALVSGLSVFVNAYGVHALPSAPVYTTAKNLTAFALLALVVAVAAVAGAAGARKRGGPGAGASLLRRFVGTDPGADRSPGSRPSLRTFGVGRWLGLAYVGIVGGGVAFALFFEGLARTGATPAAVDRDTLVVWVALLAGPFLGERVTRWNVGAMALLVAGELALSLGGGRLHQRTGDLLVLAATVLWAVEVVVLRRLLAAVSPATVGLVRMGIGSATLLVELAVTGALRSLGTLRPDQVGWVLLTGALLATYVGTWTTALARARALDVTSVLVASAVVTALLEAAAGIESLAPQALGLALVGAGTAVVVLRAPRWVPARARREARFRDPGPP